MTAADGIPAESGGGPAASLRYRVWHCRLPDACEAVDDELAEESPLEIRVKGRAVCVTMRTPGDRLGNACGTYFLTQNDRELAAGFLLSEGVVQGVEDIDHIAACTLAVEGNVLNVFLSPHVAFNEQQLTRHVFASSSCGVCGKASIDAILGGFPSIAPPTTQGAQAHWTIAADVLVSLPDKLRDAQHGFGRTGGLHAAGLFTMQGDLIVAREDVGRHNAVDKVLGHALLNNALPLGRHVLMVSGRVSFEVMQKALAAGVPVVAAVSAPSSLAVAFAQDSGQTLAGFVRDQRFNLYAHPGRVGGLSANGLGSANTKKTPAD